MWLFRICAPDAPPHDQIDLAGDLISSTPIKNASSRPWSSRDTERARHSISMDSTGYWHDNVFVERFWKSIKYEEVYLHAYETLNAAQQGLERCPTFYNQTRPHRALDGHTPDGVYVDNLPTRVTAA